MFFLVNYDRMLFIVEVRASATRQKYRYSYSGGLLFHNPVAVSRS